MISVRTSRPWNAAAVLAAAFFFCWPAMYNRYPLLYPDSITYIGDGRIVAAALFLHHMRAFSWMRSAFYSLGILGFHCNRTPWPVVALQATLTAWVLWLMLRSVLRRHLAAVYAGFAAVLGICTGVGWFVSFVMPDILGALLLLTVYLLVFARETLSNLEARILMVLAGWALLAHTTHLLLGLAVCATLLLMAAVGRSAMRPYRRGVATFAVILALAFAAQFSINAYLYHAISLNPQRPPMLLARITADGPGRLYAQQHCAQHHWTICDYAGKLTADENDFLWSGDGVLASAPPAAQQAMQREELPFALATLRAYPLQQLRVSARNFWQQLTYFDLDDFGNSTWMESALNDVMPGSEAHYLRSRQSRDAMYSDGFSTLQQWLVYASLLAIAVLLPWLWRRRDLPMLGLAMIVLPALVVNAALTGVLSGIDARYQARLIWLVPLLAGLFVVRRIYAVAFGSSSGL